MKRPEGVSAPTTRGAATPPPTPPRTRTTPESSTPRAPKPAATPGPPRASRKGDARERRADVRAAQRARKRYERDEVKRFTRRARRRRLTALVIGALTLSVVVLVVAAVFSPLLALRTITVDGTSRLQSSVVEKALDGQLGTPLALLDEGRITRELAQFRLIRSYVTEIVPPGTLVVHVVERTPIGTIAGPDGFELVDPAGVVVETSSTRPSGYPLIELNGAGVRGAGYASLAQVLLALPPAVLAQVDTVTAQTRDDVTLTLSGSQQRVVWGSAENSDAKAKLLQELIALHGGDGPGEYDVSASGTAVFHQA